MKRISWVALSLVSSAVVTGVCAAGCGPSFQAIYEGDAHFEHCYALDDTPSTPMQEKGACWRDWTLHYTYGQTRDRVDYAVARHRALSRVNGAPTDEAMMQAAPGEGSEGRPNATPAPTSAFAPPPKTMAGMDAGGGNASPVAPLKDAPSPGGSSAPTEPPPPGAECSDECTRTWRTCSGGCTAGGCDKCQKTFKACMKACFKSEAPLPRSRGAISAVNAKL